MNFEKTARLLGLAFMAVAGLTCRGASDPALDEESASGGSLEGSTAEAAGAITSGPECISIKREFDGGAADAMINEEGWQLSDNYGSLALITAGVINGTRRQTLIQWDLGLIPAGSTLLSAAAHLNVTSNGPGAPQVHLITAPWSEATVSWQSFGGAFDPAVLAGFSNGYPGSHLVGFDLLPTVKGWMDGTIPNNGILIEQTGPNYTRIKSSEWGVYAQRPSLDVCYRAPCPDDRLDCDGQGFNGCEVSRFSHDNCGGCGINCGTGACVAGACVAPLCTGIAQLSAGPALTGFNGPDTPVASDLNGDGRPDLAVTNGGASGVSVRINTGNGTFAPKVDYPTPIKPSALVAADLNGDGKPDFAAPINFGTIGVSVLLNKGNGTFSPRVDYPTDAVGPYAITAADVDGDGELDLIITNRGSSSVSVRLNAGGGTFPAKVDYATGVHPTAVAAADLNGDGRRDLVIANLHGNTLSVLLNAGGGAFAPKVDYPTGALPRALTVSDLNGDGKLDVAVANSQDGTASVLLGLGDGTFAAKVDRAVGTTPTAISAFDVNNDGKPDLAVVNLDSNTVSVLRNTSDGSFAGSFAAKVDYPAGVGPFAMTVADLNNDGRADLAVTNSNAGGVTILLGECAVDYCAPNHCVHGICVNGPHDYTCQSCGNYLGKNCDQFNYCVPNNCVHGSCVNGPSDYSCQSCGSYIGKNCDQFNYCAPNPCQNGGSCINGPSSSTCACPGGFFGSTCQWPALSSSTFGMSPTIFGHSDTAEGVSLCPSGMVATGLWGIDSTTLLSGSDRYIIKLGLICAPLLNDTGALGAVTEAPRFGWEGIIFDAHEFTVTCGPNEVVVGFSGYGNSGDQLDQISISCAATPSWRNGVLSSVHGPIGGSLTNVPYTGTCPAGYVITSADIRYGSLVSGMSATCTKTNPP